MKKFIRIVFQIVQIVKNLNKCINCNFYNIEKGIDFYFCFENCEYDYNKCYMKDQKYFPISNSNSDTSIYSYEINSDLNELKEKNKNKTFIYLPPETVKFIMEQFNLDEEKDKLTVMISDYPSDKHSKSNK